MVVLLQIYNSGILKKNLLMAIHGDLTVFNAVKYITLLRRILGSSGFAVISVVTLSTLTLTKRFVASVTPFAVNVLVVMVVILPPRLCCKGRAAHLCGYGHE